MMKLILIEILRINLHIVKSFLCKNITENQFIKDKIKKFFTFY